MKKRLTSLSLVLALSFSLSLPASAVDDNNYYSFDPVGSGELSLPLDRPLSFAVSHDGFLAEDSNNLARIMTDLTTTGLTTLKSYIIDIRDSLSRGGSVFRFLSDITNALTAQSVHGTLVWYLKHMYSSLASIDSSITAAFGGQGLATENTLSAFKDYFSNSSFVVSADSSLTGLNSFLGWVFDLRPNGQFFDDPKPYLLEFFDPNTSTYHSHDFSWGVLMAGLYGNSSMDAMLYTDGAGYRYTLYHYVRNLSDVLASEDDKQLAENYKENRDEAQKDFLSGQSGPSSLGQGDFSNASQVGGALNDTFNMGGAAKVSDFLSGFGSAGSESQAWFSQTTANNLNAVEAGDRTSGVSTFADDGETMVDVDFDPYNMRNIFERYDWLEGVQIDD